MSDEMKSSRERTAIPDVHAGRLFPVPRLSTIVAVVVIGLLLYAFATKLTMQFYASALFLFYSFTNSMWVSVMMLGVFQTLLLIPFRVINLLKGANIEEFSENIEKIKQDNDQQYLLKSSVRGGRKVALYYLVNFFVQVTSYVSIGRLFLTDFYNSRLDPWLLYDFVPYPDYPIKDRFFKLPYLWYQDTKDLGMHWVWVAWIIIVAVQVVIYVVRGVRRRTKQAPLLPSDSPQAQMLSRVTRYATGYMVVFLFLAWLFIRHLPVDWSVRIFTGDVSIPNRQFNTLTAIATFLTLIWVNLPKIQKQVDLARAAGIPDIVVRMTQRDLFKDTFKVAAFVGFGAYFITNQIPSAFELSIFTLEVISLFSPLTLDRVILASVKSKEVVKAETSNQTSESGEDEEKVQMSEKS